MVDIRKEFPRKYMSAADLDDGQLTAQIVSAEMKTYQSGDPVLMLTLRHRGTAPKMVRCNQTNRNILAGAWGWDTDGWLDKKIELSVRPTAMGPGIAMCPAKDSQEAATASVPPPPMLSRPTKPATKPPQHKSRIEDDEIP
jgi:hypothetical protein